MKQAAAAGVLILSSLASGQAQQRGAPPPAQPPVTQPAAQPAQAPAENAERPAGRLEAASAADEKASQTSHVLRLDGRDIKYTATAGTLPIRLDDGKVAARMFFVAYTKDGDDVRTRPIAFLYNGGPGSASVWLHMGSFGPRRVQMGDEGAQPSPPYQLVDNDQSLLDVTDLVFVDAIDTGYSRVMAGVNASQFHGQSGDIRSFGEFINEYLGAYARWPSPKLLIGESYGTIRSAGLADELQSRHGIELNGIALVSSLLTYQTLSPAPNNDIPYAVLVPSFAATAWFHKKLPADLQAAGLKKVIDEARAFAFGEYAAALTKGNTLTDAEQKAIAQKLARYTGLPEGFVVESNLRVSAGRFRKELLRDTRLTLGRYDARFTGLDRDAAGEQSEYDPSDAAVKGAITATFQQYVRDELKWETDMHYPTLGAQVQPWTYDQNRYMDMTDALRRAMAKNPFLRVFVACGYYDLATPFAGSEFNVSHLAFDRSISERVSLGYYESGHMIYLRPSAHKLLRSDIARFITGAGQRSRREKS
jgi:carboxypeptidase C (cathepsin A)